MKKIILLSNGPGEVWGWARPLCKELKKRGYRTSLWLLPCPFSSGREQKLSTFLDSDEVHGPVGTAGTFFDLRNAEGHMVIQLGGDLIFGRYLSALKGIPLICYSYGPKKGMGKCSAVLSAFDWMTRRINRKTGCNVELVGDLALDSLKMDIPDDPWEARSGPRIVLFPGSRPKIRERGRLFLTEFVKILLENIPDLQIRTPFLPDLEMSEQGKWEEAGLCPTTCGAGTVLRGADLAVTQPGTNNFEIMHTGTPAVIALPFEFLDVVPLQGLKGIITSLPLLGAWVKTGYLRKMDRSTGYLSWPNRMANKEIFAEIRGDLTPRDLSEFVMSILSDRDRLEEMRLQLMAMSSGSPVNASSNICDVVERLV